MSTYYRTSEMVKLDDIKEKCKIVSLEESEHASNRLGLVMKDTENGSYMHFALTEDGYVCDYFRYGGNSVGNMLEEIERLFNVEAISEYEEEYMGLHHSESTVMYFSFDDPKDNPNVLQITIPEEE